MGRDVGRHAHGNTRGAVDQHVGNGRWQNLWFLQRAVKVINVVDGVQIQLAQNFNRRRGKPGFRVAHRRGRIAIDAAEVPLPIHQQVTFRKILSHSRHGIINSGVAVRMIFAQNLANDTRGFFMGSVVADAHIVHGVQNSALDRLQPIPRVGQRPRNDHAHRIIQVGLLHFGINIDFLGGG